MSIREQIAQLVQAKPRHFSQIIPRNPDIWAEVKTIPGQTTAEKVFRYLNPQENPMCSLGNRKKFTGINAATDSRKTTSHHTGKIRGV